VGPGSNVQPSHRAASAGYAVTSGLAGFVVRAHPAASSAGRCTPTSARG